jgi:hypothetical protein
VNPLFVSGRWSRERRSRKRERSEKREKKKYLKLNIRIVLQTPSPILWMGETENKIIVVV